MIRSEDTAGSATCIAGLVQDGHVHLVADSAGVRGYHLERRKDPKIFCTSSSDGRLRMVFGCTTSFRMMQLLRFQLTPPRPRQGADLFRWMCTDVIDAIRKTLKKGGFARVADGVESGGRFLVGVRTAGESRLFCVDTDFQVGESERGFAAVGCGRSYALGALDATRGQDAPDRLEAAIRTASHFSAGVAPPFRYASTDGLDIEIVVPTG